MSLTAKDVKVGEVYELDGYILKIIGFDIDNIIIKYVVTPEKDRAWIKNRTFSVCQLYDDWKLVDESKIQPFSKTVREVINQKETPLTEDAEMEIIEKAEKILATEPFVDTPVKSLEEKIAEENAKTILKKAESVFAKENKILNTGDKYVVYNKNDTINNMSFDYILRYPLFDDIKTAIKHNSGYENLRIGKLSWRLEEVSVSDQDRYEIELAELKKKYNIED